MATTPLTWLLPDRRLTIGSRPLVLGIVNITPDSFSDGGSFFRAETAVAHGLELARQGADLLDIGGESTRPGSQPISVEEELRRVVPVIAALAAQCAVPLSVDTSKAEVARQCLDAGARIINDVTALRGDPDMTEVVRARGAGLILMHMQGTPATMQQAPRYNDIGTDIRLFFEERLHHLAASGIAPEQVVLDPGIGFGKALTHNLEILARLEEFQSLSRPVCLGVSRKGFLGSVLRERPVGQRLAGSLAAVCGAVCRGAAQILRVHDVQETCDAVTLLEAIRAAGAFRPAAEAKFSEIGGPFEPDESGP
jgi:dihydropteroate synthase